jgi:hypothetical protein
MTNKTQELTRQITTPEDLKEALRIFPKAKVEFSFYNQATTVGYYSAEVRHVTLFSGNYDTNSPLDGFYNLVMWIDEDHMPPTDEILSRATKKIARKIGIHSEREELDGPYGFCNPTDKKGEYRKWRIGELRGKIQILEDFLGSIKRMSAARQIREYDELCEIYAKIRGGGK